jgi:hypothetical protein
MKKILVICTLVFIASVAKASTGDTCMTCIGVFVKDSAEYKVVYTKTLLKDKSIILTRLTMGKIVIVPENLNQGFWVDSYWYDYAWSQGKLYWHPVSTASRDF